MSDLSKKIKNLEQELAKVKKWINKFAYINNIAGLEKSSSGEKDSGVGSVICEESLSKASIPSDSKPESICKCGKTYRQHFIDDSYKTCEFLKEKPDIYESFRKYIEHNKDTPAQEFLNEKPAEPKCPDCSNLLEFQKDLQDWYYCPECKQYFSPHDYRLWVESEPNDDKAEPSQYPKEYNPPKDRFVWRKGELYLKSEPNDDKEWYPPHDDYKIWKWHEKELIKLQQHDILVPPDKLIAEFIEKLNNAESWKDITIIKKEYEQRLEE